MSVRPGVLGARPAPRAEFRRFLLGVSCSVFPVR
jgi:hypothetical protein